MVIHPLIALGQKHRQRQKNMIEIIKRLTINVMAISVDIDEYEEYMLKHNLIGSAYTFCAHVVIAGLRIGYGRLITLVMWGSVSLPIPIGHEYDAPPTKISGENLVRLVFLDESGRSRHEPIIVVAGIIVHGDRTYRKPEQCVRKIATATIPEEDRDGFIFHAGDLFQGAGYFKDKDTWPRERRFTILRSLAGVPRKLRIPIVFGHFDKSEKPRRDNREIAAHLKPRDMAHANDIVQHMAAFSRAEIAIERQMLRFPRDEICMLIAEDTDRVKRALKDAHAFLRDRDAVATSALAGISNLPLTKIVDTPHFAAKSDSVPLQIADVCAYLILRRLLRRSDSQEFFELLAPQLTWTARDFGARMGAEQFGTGSLV